MERTKDRMHRRLKYDITRPYKRYESTRITSKPTVRHLFVKLQMEEAIHERVEISNSGLKSRLHPVDCLEPLVFHIMLLLERFKKPSLINKSELDSQRVNMQDSIDVDQFISDDLKMRFERETNSILKVSIQSILDSIHASGKQIDEITMEVFSMALSSFIKLSKIFYLQQLTKRQRNTVLNSQMPIDLKYSVEDDLLSWMKSIGVNNVSASCQELTNRADIPAFVTSNIILRTPLSANELYSQLDIWSNFISSILTYYSKQENHLRDCLNNLIFYCIHHDIRKMPEILLELLNFVDSKKSASISMSFLSQKMVNDLIWEMYYNYYRSARAEKGLFVSKIIQSQEILVNLLSRVGDQNDKVLSKLNLKGYMGIVLAIENVSLEKATKLFQMAEERFLVPQTINQNTNKELTCYNFVKIALLKSTDDLMFAFNMAVQRHPNSSSLWLALIQKLIEFDLLTEERCQKILKQLVDKKNDILITKDMLLLLLSSISTSSSLFRMIETISEGSTNPKDSILFSAHSQILLEKYVTLLYKLPKNTLITFPSFWSTTDSTMGSSRIKSLAAARYLYDTYFPIKGPKIIGIMLNGEAKQDPSQVYDLYQRDLFEKNNFLPDESCISALLTASSASTNHRPILWGQLYAPQVAIHEFKKHVVSDTIDFTDLDSAHIYPGNQLWQKYIGLLSKFDYIYELSELIQWWTKIKFTPNKKTLFSLLHSFPIEFAERYIIHFEKIKKDSVSEITLPSSTNGEPTKQPETSGDWPWPTLAEFRHHRNNKL